MSDADNPQSAQAPHNIRTCLAHTMNTSGVTQDTREFIINQLRQLANQLEQGCQVRQAICSLERQLTPVQKDDKTSYDDTMERRFVLDIDFTELDDDQEPGADDGQR